MYFIKIHDSLKSPLALRNTKIKLTNTDKIVYGLIEFGTANCKRCTWKISTFADKAHVSYRQVERSLDKLEKLKLIRMTRNTNGLYIYSCVKKFDDDYIPLYDGVLDNSDLTLTEKIIYSHFKQYANNAKNNFPVRYKEEIAEECDCSLSTVKTAMKKLISLEYMKLKAEINGTYYYSITKNLCT